MHAHHPFGLLVSLVIVEVAVERGRAFRLDDGDVRALVEEAQVVQLAQRLAVRGAVTQVAARHHNTVGRLPVALLQQLEYHRLLALKAERIDRVEDIDAELGRNLHEQRLSIVKVTAQLQGEGAKVERLRQFAKADLALGHEHDGQHAGA